MRLRRVTLPSGAQLVTVLHYGAAGVLYVAIGVGFTDFLLSVLVGMAYLLVAVWLVPEAVRRLR